VFVTCLNKRDNNDDDLYLNLYALD